MTVLMYHNNFTRLLVVPKYQTNILSKTLACDSVTKKGIGHTWPDFWTQRSTVKTDNLSRSTTVHTVLILGQLDKEM